MHYLTKSINYFQIMQITLYIYTSTHAASRIYCKTETHVLIRYTQLNAGVVRSGTTVIGH